VEEAAIQSLKLNGLGFDGDNGWHGQLLEVLGDPGAARDCNVINYVDGVAVPLDTNGKRPRRPAS
jgi:hypothetical protein